jgi:hypothetical protein
MIIYIGWGKVTKLSCRTKFPQSIIVQLLQLSSFYDWDSLVIHCGLSSVEPELEIF